MWIWSIATFQEQSQNSQQILTILKKHLIIHLLLCLISWTVQFCIGQSFWMIMTPLTITKIRACDTSQRTSGHRLWSSAPSTLILMSGVTASTAMHALISGTQSRADVINCESCGTEQWKEKVLFCLPATCFHHFPCSDVGMHPLQKWAALKI